MNRILSTNRHRFQKGLALVLGNSVRVEVNGEVVESIFIPCLRVYDKKCKNQVGQLGAFFNETDSHGINRKIVEFRKKYPELDIQENHK